MPDGDIIHSRLGRLYQKPYQQLCEGKATDEECVTAILQALKQDLMRQGNLPIRLAQSISKKLAQAINTAGDNKAVDWPALSLKLDQLGRKFDGPPYIKELVLDVGKQIIGDFRYGREANTMQLSSMILQRYMNGVCQSAFQGRISLTNEHYAGADHAALSRRIEAIQPILDQGIRKFAEGA